MYCVNCGTKNTVDSRFCKQCGQRLDRAAAPRISEDDFDRALPEEEQMNALLERAYRLRRGGDHSGAVALCEQALHLRPDSTSAHSLLGQLYEASGDRGQAIREYERVLQLNPGSIADRVKLDELRGESRLASRVRGVSPRIVLADSASLSMRRHTLLAAATIGIALILAAGVLAMRLVDHLQNAFSRPAAASPVVPAGHQAAVTAPSSPKNGQANAATASPTTSSEANGSLGPLTIGAQPPIVIYTTTAPPRNATASATKTDAAANGGAAASSALPPGNRSPASSPKAPKEARKSDRGSGRVVLAGETSEDVQDNGNGQYTIRVTDSGKSKDGAEGSDRVKLEENPGTVKISVVRPSSEGAGSRAPGADSGNLPSADAHALIVMGSDYMLKEDYVRARTAFFKALPTAGDETANVYQQIALCYQRKGDKANARNNYDKAKTEYQKLLNTGRQADVARVGIRTCETGLKICNSE